VLATTASDSARWRVVTEKYCDFEVLRDSIGQRSRIARWVLSRRPSRPAIPVLAWRSQNLRCLSQAVSGAKKIARPAQGRPCHNFFGEFSMRTNIEFGALCLVEPAEMKAVEGGGVIAFDASAGSVLSKYLDEIEERLSPTPDFSQPRDLDRVRLYP
jgi:hypothetical protein